MSFGVGVGDIALITRSAWRLYKACKDSSEDFSRLSCELLSLHAVLTETQEFLAEHHPHLDPSRRHRLAMLYEGCQDTLDGLEAIVVRYESLGTQSQRAWDRARFGLKDLTEIRERLGSSLTLLTAFNTAMINSSTARIERKLNKFLAEIQAGLREGSVVTTTEDVAQTIETADNVWSEFRHELTDIGITESAAEENRMFIAERLRVALAEGKLDEVAPVPPASDSGYGSFSLASGCSAESTSISSAAGMSAANLAFEEELRRQRAEWNPDGVAETDASGGGAGARVGSTLSIKVRRRTGPVGLVKKWFLNDKAILEAASDGDEQRVAELIGLGVDVNTRDRWGWSALTMCAYGGHKGAARLLLDHGADMDTVDVDGDTPTSLAAQRRHTELVIMFDEEREMRDLRIREADNEMPRRLEAVSKVRSVSPGTVLP